VGFASVSAKCFRESKFFCFFLFTKRSSYSPFDVSKQPLSKMARAVLTRDAKPSAAIAPIEDLRPWKRSRMPMTPHSCRHCSLAANPHAAPNVKAPQGQRGFRLRVGDWRDIYTLNDAVLTVLIIRIAPP
jgi:mRNA interferase RelE/StbE